ncbi:F-box only protein 6-like isoform X8 [Tachysurus fulvidraco]|uniref:F-box only protein 6-like isoform X8 n=1 Tax=Tachysurus fulvidraco TaxID=1234273 RepID=UPI000F50D6ED|nr:F-box only protein 6-like isoform X8 [Tachysurus fulvidraco]
MFKRKKYKNQTARDYISQPQWPTLPLAIIEEILLNLPGHQVICVCRLVCSEWKSVVDSNAFWRKRCRREGLKPLNIHKVPRHWQMFYFLCKMRRNLLKNPNADGFAGWKIEENGGDGWIKDCIFVPHPDETVTKCFVTSYEYAPRWDCGSEYQIQVELLNHRKRTVQSFESEPVFFPQWNDQKWEEMTYTFKDYGPGIRFIRFKHGGKDTQYWAGHYGIRVTHSSVEISPSA